MRLKIGWKLWAPVAFWLALAAAYAIAQEPATVRSTRGSRESLSITLYNSDFALIRETRRVSLPAGAVQLGFEDVPSTIEPATVHLSTSRGLDVLDQSYEYDLLSPQRLLAKYIGKEMTLVLRSQQGGSTQDEDVKALLLSTNGPVWKIGNDIVTGLAPVGYRFPELPSELRSQPTLVWGLRNEQAGERELNVSYLADNMTWSADYVLDLSRDGRQGDLEGWVTLTNNSGASFENAQLSLVAGQVHRVNGPRPMPMMEARASNVAVGGAPQQFTQEAAGEYHLYQLNRRVTLLSDESKQLSLLATAAVPIDQSYVLDGRPDIFRMRLPQAAPAQEPVEVYLSFRNAAGAGIGQPLPAGVVRVYQPDSQGQLQLLGEDAIGHTPKDETVRVHIGNAFDIVAERHQTDFRAISPNVHESACKIILRNHKNQPVTVQVREPLGGNWEVLESNFAAKKLDASTVGFDIPVAANGTETLTYRVRVTD